MVQPLMRLGLVGEPMSGSTSCLRCRATSTGRQRKWCSERCRKRAGISRLAARRNRLEGELRVTVDELDEIARTAMRNRDHDARNNRSEAETFDQTLDDIRRLARQPRGTLEDRD